MFGINGIQKQSINLEEGESLYYVTDLHGNFTMLKEALNLLGFGNNHNDKLYIIGDLVDRGTESMDVLGFARYNENVFPSRGNHEAIAYYGATKEKASSLPFWMANGGKWHLEKDINYVTEMLEWAYGLPDGFELTINGEHKIGLVHASIPQNPHDYLDWNVAIEEFNSQIGIQNKTLWSYALENRTLHKRGDRRNVDGIDALLHGHVVVGGEPEVYGNRVYMDGGAGLVGDKFALIILEYNPNKPKILGLFDVHRFQYDPYTNSLEML